MQRSLTGAPRQDHPTSRRKTLLAVMDLGAQNLVLGRMWEVGYPEKDDKT